MKLITLTILAGLLSFASFANDDFVVQCSSQKDARIIQIDLVNLNAIVIDNNRSILLKHIAPDKDGFIEFDGSGLNVLFSYKIGSSKGIGQASLSDSSSNIPMWCNHIK